MHFVRELQDGEASAFTLKVAEVRTVLSADPLALPTARS